MAMQEALFLSGPICFLLEICLWRPSSRADSYFSTRKPKISVRKPQIWTRNPNISTRNPKFKLFLKPEHFYPKPEIHTRIPGRFGTYHGPPAGRGGASCWWRPSSRAGSRSLTRNLKISTWNPKISSPKPQDFYPQPEIHTRNPGTQNKSNQFKIKQNQANSGHTLVLKLGAAEQVVGGGHHCVQIAVLQLQLKRFVPELQTARNLKISAIPTRNPKISDRNPKISTQNPKFTPRFGTDPGPQAGRGGASCWWRPSSRAGSGIGSPRACTPVHLIWFELKLFRGGSGWDAYINA